MGFLSLSTTDFKSYLEELKPVYTKYKNYALTKVDQRIVLAAAVLTTVAVGLYFSSSKIAGWYKGKKEENDQKQLQDENKKLNDLRLDFPSLVGSFNFLNDQVKIEKLRNDVGNEISTQVTQAFESEPSELTFFENFVLDETQSVGSRALVASQLGKLFEKKAENIAKKAGKENHEVFLFALQAFNFFNIGLNLQSKDAFKVNTERMRDKIRLILKETSELDFFEDFLFEDSKFPEIRGLIANHLGDLCEGIATQAIENQDEEIGILNFWEPTFVAFDFFERGALVANKEAEKNSSRLIGIIEGILTTNFENIQKHINYLQTTYSLAQNERIEIEDKEIAEKILKEITFFTDFMCNRSKNPQLKEIILKHIVDFYKNGIIIRSTGETLELVNGVVNEDDLIEKSNSEESHVKRNTSYSSPWKQKESAFPDSDRLDKVKKTLSFKDETP